MSDRIAAVEAYRNAIVKGDGDIVAGYLADDVVVETNFGRAEGIEAVLTLLREPRTAGLLAAGAHWSAPAASGDTITVTAELPATAPFGGVEFVFAFAGPKIARVEHQILRADLRNRYQVRRRDVRPCPRARRAGAGAGPSAGRPARRVLPGRDRVLPGADQAQGDPGLGAGRVRHVLRPWLAD